MVEHDLTPIGGSTRGTRSRADSSHGTAKEGPKRKIVARGPDVAATARKDCSGDASCFGR